MLIEVTNSLSTDSFLRALMRFISRRRKLENIFSDQGGSNFAADKEFRQDIETFKQVKINKCVKQRHIEWQLNNAIQQSQKRSSRAINQNGSKGWFGCPILYGVSVLCVGLLRYQKEGMDWCVV